MYLGTVPLLCDPLDLLFTSLQFSCKSSKTVLIHLSHPPPPLIQGLCNTFQCVYPPCTLSAGTCIRGSACSVFVVFIPCAVRTLYLFVVCFSTCGCNVSVERYIGKGGRGVGTIIQLAMLRGRGEWIYCIAIPEGGERHTSLFFWIVVFVFSEFKINASPFIWILLSTENIK